MSAKEDCPLLCISMIYLLAVFIRGKPVIFLPKETEETVFSIDTIDFSFMDDCAELSTRLTELACLLS